MSTYSGYQRKANPVEAHDELFSRETCPTCGSHLLRDCSCLNGCHLDKSSWLDARNERDRMNARARCAARG